MSTPFNARIPFTSQFPLSGDDETMRRNSHFNVLLGETSTSNTDAHLQLYSWESIFVNANPRLSLVTVLRIGQRVSLDGKPLVAVDQSVDEIS